MQLCVLVQMIAGIAAGEVSCLLYVTHLPTHNNFRRGTCSRSPAIPCPM